MKRTVVSFVIIGLMVLLAPSRLLGVWTPPGGSPLANGEHPRIWMTNASLPSIRARLATGGAYHTEFQNWVSYMDSVYVGANTQPAQFVQPYAVDFAFIYRLGPISGISYKYSNANYGALAKACLMALPSFGISWHTPVAYDWLNDLLSTGEKQTLVTFMETANQGMALPGMNSFNSQVPYARAPVILGGLAFAGDGIDDATARTYYSTYTSTILGPAGVLDSENWWAATDGGASQGYSYTAAYTMRALLGTVEGWRTANGLARTDVYPSANYFRYYPQLVAYLMLPHATPDSSQASGYRHNLWKTQAMNAAIPVSGFPDNYTFLPALAGIYEGIDANMSSLAQWLTNTQLGPTPVSGPLAVNDAVFGSFLNGTKSAPAKSPSALGLSLSKEFHSGWVSMRTGWDSLDDTLVAFSASPFFRTAPGYSNMDPGSFTIDRKGPQVIDQGYLVHDWASGSTYAKNTLTFPDRSISADPSTPFPDLGGHRVWYPDLDGYGKLVENSSWDERDDMRFVAADADAGRDVDYVSANVTRAYNSSLGYDSYNVPKVGNFVRDLVYLRPARPGIDSDIVVIYDRASTLDTKYVKTWLLHTAGEPFVNGNQITGQPIRNGSATGHWTYSGADLITATNTVNGANGRVFCKVLLPASHVIVKVGGPNAAGRSFTTDSHEYEDPYGVQGPVQDVPTANMAPYVGSYRIEITPATPSIDDTFLNVVEVTDAGVTTPTPATLLRGTGIAALRIGGRVLAFNAQKLDIRSAQFTVDAGGSYKIHIADLARGGTYDIGVNGQVTRMVASQGGTLYFPTTVTSGAPVTVNYVSGGTLATEPLPMSNLPPIVAAPVPPTGLRVIR